ncbi:MAG: hypothetical protein JO090_01410 [Rhizobacter sp.]|nr:hypothetical protein [Rhizobacter sp.]
MLRFEMAGKNEDPREPSTGDARQAPHAVPDDVPSGIDRDRDTRAETRRVVNGEPAPRLPHERDESSDSGTAAPSDVMERAHDDAESGKAPTDKSEATDEVYRRSLRDRTPGAERD